MSAALYVAAWIGLGIGIGAYGTLIGAGGGFILVPILLLLYQHEPAVTVTAVSLAVVSVNATSGSYSYLRMGRVDLRTGVILAAATLPGAVIGALVVGYVPRRVFDLVMGLALIIVAGYLFLRPGGSHPLWSGGRYAVSRRLTDSGGTEYAYRFNLLLAALFSVGIGFLSSLLGIGGGIIQVPLLIGFFAFPAHIATATSQFALMFTAATGTVTHVAHHDYGSLAVVTLLLAAGVLVGAQAGAALSGRIGGPLITRLLTLALGLVGLRLLFS